MADQQQSTYLKYLPAVFHAESKLPDGIPLGQYLLTYESIFNQFDRLLSTLDLFFAPDLAPAEEFLSWLATWVALPLDDTWEEDQKRRLIQEAVELYRWRGTVYGLKRYLELCAGVLEDEVDIAEARWPAGMQIGVASRLGGKKSIGVADAPPLTRLDVSKHDYYVVHTVASPDTEPQLPPSTPLRLYYRTAWVKRIDIEQNGVRIYYGSPKDGTMQSIFHAKPDASSSVPNITRSSELVEYQYRCTLREAGVGTKYYDYSGSTALIDSIAVPYRFIVHIKIPAAELQNRQRLEQRLNKIRNVLELEKPAHTDYYLKVSLAKPVVEVSWMQIEVRSSIGLDTTIG